MNAIAIPTNAEKSADSSWICAQIAGALTLSVEELLAEPELVQSAPNLQLPSRWYVCKDQRSADDLLFDSAAADDLYGLKVAIEHGADFNRAVHPREGMRPLEYALSKKSHRVAMALSRICDPLGETACEEPYFVIAACMDMVAEWALLRERTTPLLSLRRPVPSALTSEH